VNNSGSNPGRSGLSRAISFLGEALPYVYLLRVPLISLLLLITFPFVAIWFAPSLLRGIFDVTQYGIGFVTLTATLTSWTLMVTAWQIFLYGPERFGIPPFPWRSRLVMQRPTRRGHSFVFVFFAVPAVGVGAYVSVTSGTSTLPRLLAGILCGGVAAILVLIGGGQFKGKRWTRLGVATKGLAMLGPGFAKEDGSVHEGHYLALWSFLLCFFVYVAIGVMKSRHIGHQPVVPTLADLLVFEMIACWGLTAVTFLLDRFRVPVFLPLLLVIVPTAHIPWTDHYFRMVGAEDSRIVKPEDVIRSGKKGTSVILVAASGGGIKAAAWTTRVLTGLEEESRAAFPTNASIFGDSVRLISGVSGGSVGTMYFFSEYDLKGGGLPKDSSELEKAVGDAEASSLDDIAWGLVYPDFIRVFFPVLKYEDRGEALERALTRETEKQPAHIWKPLSEWRKGATEGWYPAIVLNATIVESGQRLLLGTTDLKSMRSRTSLQEMKTEGLSGLDVTLVTAARLSATFPYVSPAARPDAGGAQIHVVDGGYTDNYGMATLLSWADEALSAADNPVRRVLIIEIRASPPSSGPNPKTQGWPYQSYAPISTMLNVRDLGQLSRNDEEREVLKRLEACKQVEIDDAVFEYNAENAPLSWHLSPADEKDIEEHWESKDACERKNAVAEARSQVHDFLAGSTTPMNCK